MQDFRIVQAKTLLTITAVAPIRGFSPPSIVVLGNSLDKTQEVLYNNTAADEFIISSPSRIIVKIPASQIGKDLLSIQALSSASLTKQNATISLEFLNPPTKISGIDRLVQSWMIIFLTTPGSDVFSPTSGGGVRGLVGKNSARGNSGTNLTSDLILAVERTKNELLRLQSKDSRIPPDEKLLSASTSNVLFNPSTTSLSATVTLQNMVGQNSSLNIG